MDPHGTGDNDRGVALARKKRRRKKQVDGQSAVEVAAEAGVIVEDPAPVVDGGPGEPEAADGGPGEPEAADGGPAELADAEPEAAKPTAPGRKDPDRRQHGRFVVGGGTKGRVTSIYDARILDISPGGSLIEHAHLVRPGTMSSLDLDLLGKRMSLKCRVARSVVHRSEVQPDGEQALIYRTGLEFLHPSDETRQVISDFIRSIIVDGNKG
ncbi:MAG: PilZ domain-containing protein [candidate division NC10 bacterium]